MKKNIFKVAMFAALIGFTGVSAIMVKNIHQSVGSAIIASSNSTPAAWSEIPTSSDAKVELDVITNDAVVLYTVKITNTRSDDPIYLTNLASYLDEAHGNHDGFLPLNSNTVEYTYNPADAESWTALELSAPKNSTKGFRLANTLAIAPSSPLYVRYQLTPSLDQDVLSNKVAVLLDDGSGYLASATGSNSVAIDIESSPVVVAADTESSNPNAIFDEMAAAGVEGDTNVSVEQTIAASEDNGDSAFARPLGVFSEVTNLQTVASIATADNTVDENFVNVTSIILVSILAVFAIAFIGYIVVVKY